MDKNYTPAQFVRDYLPDYRKRLIDCFGSKTISGMESIMEENDFLIRYFSEALEAFAGAQREECAKAILTDAARNHGCYGAVLDAPMPEPAVKIYFHVSI